jgi:hypothetical protein
VELRSLRGNFILQRTETPAFIAFPKRPKKMAAAKEENGFSSIILLSGKESG